MTELGLAKRYLNIFSEHGIEVVGEFMDKLQQGGDDALLEIPGIGRKILADIKRELRNRGYELPETVE
jgi:DNA-directed RNA polymerase alpha subunit